ncbi:MAG: hypothetical protein EZS28_029116 [Streblomastix strix]|uniref:BEACH domain-containing protein n=1 Tax=Streblomastix strix TaxID=222440 RepID=A0A5J4UXB1_9EUKA|nr:MAG: hypothetical protein EZS28_029116 [Streblomastix strix]
MLRLQGGTKFEVTSRLFVDIQKTWEGCLNNAADLKELIPEFYTPPGSFLLFNSQDLDLSSVQDGFTIGDVKLPPWAWKGNQYGNKDIIWIIY